MTDWRAVARAIGADFAEADLTRIAPLLGSLESAFLTLANTLDYMTEPAIVLSDSAIRGGLSEE